MTGIGVDPFENPRLHLENLGQPEESLATLKRARKASEDSRVTANRNLRKSNKHLQELLPLLDQALPHLPPEQRGLKAELGLAITEAKAHLRNQQIMI